jgi:hypothetical protein
MHIESQLWINISEEVESDPNASVVRFQLSL